MTKRATGRSLADFQIEGMETPNSLYPAEERLLKAAATGLPCQVSKALPTDTIETNRVRGAFVRFLLLGGDEDTPVHEKGIDLEGAFVEGNIDLENAVVNQTLSLWRCWVQGQIVARAAQLGRLNLSGSHVQAIDCDGAKLSENVLLRNGFVCHGEVRFINCDIRGTLDCSQGVFRNPKGIALAADSARIGSVALCNGFHAEGSVRFPNAVIAGDLDCTGGTFVSPDKIALECTNIKVARNVFFRQGFDVQGETRFAGAVIEGQLGCANGAFSNPQGQALSFDAAKVGGDVFLTRGLTCLGEVRFPGAVISGDLDCSHGLFQSEHGLALLLNRARIEGKVSLCNEFRTDGSIECVDAAIGGHLDLRKAHIKNKRAAVLVGDGVRVSGAVFLGDGFVAVGTVQLPRAKVGGILRCTGGSFAASDGEQNTDALLCNGALFSSDVFLAKGFNAKGQVNFIDAKIGGQFACSGGDFQNPSGFALICDGAEITGSVWLNDGFKAEGKVRFSRANIKGCFWCSGAQFDCATEGEALSLQSSKIGDRLWLASYDKQRGPIIRGSLSLAGAQVTSFVDDADQKSWPNMILLDGFTFERFAGNAYTDAQTRKKWLLRQSTHHLRESFRPQPFEQLINVLRKMGHNNDAKAIAVFKQQMITRRSFRWWWPFPWLWRSFLGISVGYGYHPSRTVWFAIALFAFCGFAYQQAADQGLIAPTNPRIFLDPTLVDLCGGNWTNRQCPLNQKKGHSVFNPWIFSLDAMLPIINLRQAEQWQPTRGQFELPVLGKLCPDFVRELMWVEIFLGWAASLMLTATVSGIIKKD